MSDPLATYLHDHLAGSAHAVDLIEVLRDQYAGEPLGEFADGLLAEVQADRATLKGLAERVGEGSSGLKEFSGWLAEKVSRLKLRPHDNGGLGTFEALEFLALGVYGKLELWRALAVVSPLDARLLGVDFYELAARAEAQHREIEAWRLEVARTALLRLYKNGEGS
jgi:hypothetical protein